jgi:hypothetical protein
VPSRFKRAHRTNAFAQPAGVPYPHDEPEQQRPPGGGRTAVELFEELRARVESADERAALIGVGSGLVQTWDRGGAQPLLRAHRKALERALRSLEPPPKPSPEVQA